MEQLKRFIKEKLNIENLLCLLIILLPILDMASFLFRNYFKTTYSPSTFLRPIISIIVTITIFIKEKKTRKNLILAGFIYGIYSLVHLWIFNQLKTGISYGGITNELRYIVNYSFMVLNLFLFIHVFKNKAENKLKVSVLISISIYILSIWISIITKTSSSTYIEGIGYKGWFETGNSVGAILILSMFIILNMIKKTKYRYWVISVVVLVGLYTTMMLGTRVGLLGFIISISLYILTEIILAILKHTKLNKKFIIGAIASGCVIVVGITLIGSNTIKRRQHIKDVEEEASNIHIASGILEIKEKIDNNTLEEGYMSEAQKQSIIDLYNYANAHQFANNDMRMQQLVYNAYLVKNQANIMALLFGNGFQANYAELVLEMETPAFLFNFGILGFILYFVPVLAIFIYGIYIAIKNIKKIDAEYIMLIFGIFLSFAFSFLSGYTFFHASSMLIIVTLSALLINKIYKLKIPNKEGINNN